MSRATLVFSIGPVQGFIAQSRRTADGWVGSYLLSYLMGHALKVLEDDSRVEAVVEPHLPGVPMYEAIKRSDGSKVAGDTTIAALPNTAVLTVKAGQEDVVGEKSAKTAAETEWEKVHTAIWGILPASMSSRATVKEIWERQVKAPWEFYWAWGTDSKAAFKNLAARKGLRDFSPVQEAGDRCTVCAEREALWDKDTYDRKNKKHHQARDAATENWRDWVPHINGQDGAPKNLIRSNGSERLCALCLIKRLIPWRNNPIRDLWRRGEASGDEPSVFPSTSTMATVLYRVELIQAGCSSAGAELHQKITDYQARIAGLAKRKGFGSKADPLGRFPRWVQVAGTAKQIGWKDVQDFLRFDGDWYLYGEAVKNELDLDDAEHRDLAGAYRAVLDAADNAEVGPPSIYYAVLTMDGDNMGDFKEAVEAEKVPTTKVSEILNKFAAEVPGIVHSDAHNGRVIYAGGDDVLALLPLDTALSAADALRNKYKELFHEWLTQGGLNDRLPVRTSLSGSIIYAHHQAPLGAVLRSGHTLLTDLAKKKIQGKNAVAIQRFQRGGPSDTVTVPWERDGSSFAERMRNLIEKLKGRDRQIASGLVYELKELAWMWASDGPLAGQPNHRLEFIASLIEKSRLYEHAETKAERRDRALAVARELLAVCEGAVGEDPRAKPTIEPLLIARFLAGGGREER